MIQLYPAIPVTTPLGDGIALAVKDMGQYQDTFWIIALCGNGRIVQFSCSEIKLKPPYCNAGSNPAMN